MTTNQLAYHANREKAKSDRMQAVASGRQADARMYKALADREGNILNAQDKNIQRGLDLKRLQYEMLRDQRDHATREKNWTFDKAYMVGKDLLNLATMGTMSVPRLQSGIQLR